MSPYRLLIPLGCLVLASCSTVTVTSDADPNADFTQYRTFAVRSEPISSTGGARLDSPFLQQRIAQSITDNLRAKGLLPTSEGRADLLIGYHVALKDKLDVNVVNDVYGYAPSYLVGPRRGYYGGYYGRYATPIVESRTVVDSYEQGTLVIDFADRKAGQLVWRGVGQARVHQSGSQADRQQRVHNAVTEILGDYPPQ